MHQFTPRGFEGRFVTEEGDLDRLRINTPEFSVLGPQRFPGLNRSTNLPRVT